MSKHTVCLIPGDGIGHEVVAAARQVLEAVAPALILVDADAGFGEFERRGRALPKETLARVMAADATLLGAVQSPTRRVDGYRSPVVDLRRVLELFACVRPVRTPPLVGAHPDVDLVIVRENTEGLYAGQETADHDRATTERVVTRAASRRIARYAGELARTQGRRRVTIVHKSNVLRATCGLFREAAHEALDAFDVEVDEMIVDAAAYRLAATPEAFDVIVTTNLFGDILSDVAAAAGGGIGLCASVNAGSDRAVFEPVHGAAPDIAGRGIANPLATIRATAMLLDHLGLALPAARLDAAIDQVLESGPHTPDLGGEAGTSDVVDALLECAAAPVRTDSELTPIQRQPGEDL
ncbi:MAG: isocitrate dehydrogenase [Planctomycetes bacterium]|nr:isocitrate dehydrogenase [Planctomycetota bacterium]